MKNPFDTAAIEKRIDKLTSWTDLFIFMQAEKTTPEETCKFDRTYAALLANKKKLWNIAETAITYLKKAPAATVLKAELYSKEAVKYPETPDEAAINALAVKAARQMQANIFGFEPTTLLQRIMYVEQNILQPMRDTPPDTQEAYMGIMPDTLGYALIDLAKRVWNEEHKRR